MKVEFKNKYSLIKFFAKKYKPNKLIKNTADVVISFKILLLDNHIFYIVFKRNILTNKNEIAVMIFNREIIGTI